MKKNISIGVLGAVVLILSILGIIKYTENNSIDIGFGIGKIGIGSNNKIEEGRTKKGKFYKCSENDSTISSTAYFDFSKGTLNKIAQYKMEVDVPSDYMKQHTKDEMNSELVEYICGNDKDVSMCGNLQIKWSGNHVVVTFGIDLSTSGNNFKNDMNESEFLNMMNQSHTTCEKISKAPIYATTMDPAGTYYNRAKRYYKKYETEKNVESKNNIETTNNKKTPTTENNVNKMCEQLATGNYDSKRSESVNFTFYCNKKVINPTIKINIVGQSAKDKTANYTIDSYKKYLKENFCDKYHLSNCTYTEIEGGTKEVEMNAECKTNYNGLDSSDLDQLFEKNQSIEQAIVSVCKQ